MSIGVKNRVCLIDDSMSEPILLRSAIEKSGRKIELESFRDSMDAINDLRRRSIEEDESLPSLILLDLNMPGYGGLEVLKIMKADEHLKYIPILIMTSSTLESDTKECLGAGANSVIVKPTGHQKYVDVIQGIYDYWFLTVKRIDSGVY